MQIPTTLKYLTQVIGTIVADYGDCSFSSFVRWILGTKVAGFLFYHYQQCDDYQMVCSHICAHKA